MTIYLYIKKHKVTGLKYLGMTTQKDPHAYRGSGKYWRRHIKKYGNDVETTILLVTESKNELKETGIFFSKIWNIVNSKDWANLTVENGEGGNTSDSISYKEAIKNRRSYSGSNNPMYGRSILTEKQLKWYTNGNDNTYATSDTAPIGYYPGRSKFKRKPHSIEHKLKISSGNKGKPAPNRLQVICPNGNVFCSILEAAKHCHLTVSQFRSRNINNGDWVIIRQ